MDSQIYRGLDARKAVQVCAQRCRCSSFGGITREYQARVDPNAPVSHGLSISQIEQQLANNNANAGGSFAESGLQQINVRVAGLFSTVRDIEQTAITTKNGTVLRVKDIATVTQGSRIRLGQSGRNTAGRWHHP